MKEETLSIWPMQGWQMFEIEGRKLMAPRLVFRSNPHDRTEVSNSPAFAMSPEQMRELAADLTKAAASMGTSETPPIGGGRH
ncbi:hypothetical protein [Xanthomonas sacchari]|uniref:hypothetical protein n=1 Tax=Xanthomonas sacchari TaxID=56458 RepID=UPI00224FED5D|nr:hypothetical protein [Xanthomonas sacchari]